MINKDDYGAIVLAASLVGFMMSFWMVVISTWLGILALVVLWVVACIAFAISAIAFDYWDNFLDRRFL